MAVLLWGTGYKMSLYSMAAQFGSSQSKPINLPAKLLTEKERLPIPSSLDHDNALPELAVTPSLLWIVILLARAMQVKIRLQRSSACVCLAHHLYGNEDSLLSHFGFRPPPSFYPVLS
jgi:hypothetical protein